MKNINEGNKTKKYKNSPLRRTKRLWRVWDLLGRHLILSCLTLLEESVMWSAQPQVRAAREW